jgi:Ca2+-binding RTX toxin-like protein
LTYSYSTVGSLWATSPTSGYGPEGGDGEPWSPFYGISSQSDKSFTAAILQKWANVANLTFTLVPDTDTGVGDIRFAYTYLASHDAAAAWVAGFPGPSAAAADIWFNALGTSGTDEFRPGSFAGFTVLHELGHGLGLKHPFDPSVTVNAVVPDSLDSQSFTVMSYSVSTDSSAVSTNFYPTTPMLLDIQAIQYIYGANYKYNAGDSVYSFTDANNYRETIWDGGGIDSIDYAGRWNSTIDLRAGEGSSIGNPIYAYTSTGAIARTLFNVFIAYGVTIENASGGSGNDTITGNDADNSLDGGAGNDTLYGGAGNDTFDWESSVRVGNDIFYGGTGNDTYVVDSSLDRVIEEPSEGIDIVWTSVPYSLADLPYIENLRGVGSTGLTLTGNAFGNLLSGSTGSDSINGLAGTDTTYYTARMAAYTGDPTAGGYKVTGPDGTDTLTSIERLEFADANLAFDLDGYAGQTYRLYQASFNRTPDIAGLGGWIGAMDNGATPVQVATSFMASAEFQSLYGANPTNEQFVSLLYTNALHRTADAAGMAYWVNQLVSKLQTRAQALVNLSESAENKASVLPAITNGIVYANTTQAAGPAKGQTFTGTTAADTLIGTVGNDMLTGGNGNDSINAGFGNDSINAGIGVDFINGGGGLDTAIYSGKRATYTVSSINGILKVTAGADGNDTAINVERLKFDDAILAFDTSGNAGQTYRLYQAAFNRTPDKAGLTGWVNGVDSGMTMLKVAAAFIESGEFKALYGAAPTDAQFVSLLYTNALHRAPDAAGLNYWVNQLSSNSQTREQALLGFSESTENQASLIGVIQGGIELALG